MGTRGETLHVRGLGAKQARTLLPKLGVDAVLFGVNDEWATIGFFKVVDESELVKLVKKPILQIWTDDDVGVGYRLYTPTGIDLQLNVPLRDYEFSKGDADWIKQAVVDKLLTASAAKKFRERLQAKKVVDWALAHGAEALFNVPYQRPEPYPLLRKYLRKGVEIIKGVATKKSPAKKPAAKKKAVAKSELPPSTRAWTPREKTIVDLHFYYLTNVWSLNDWKIYNRYKKHLPPQYRGEVDRLVDLMMRYQPKAMRALLESILETIWDAEDWLAVLASDELARDLDREQQDAWRTKVANIMLALARNGELR